MRQIDMKQFIFFWYAPYIYIEVGREEWEREEGRGDGETRWRGDRKGRREKGIVGSEILMDTGRVDWLMSNLFWQILDFSVCEMVKKRYTNLSVSLQDKLATMWGSVKRGIWNPKQNPGGTLDKHPNSLKLSIYKPLCGVYAISNCQSRVEIVFEPSLVTVSLQYQFCKMIVH